MKVKFMPQDIEVEIKPGQSVLNVAQDNDIHIQSVCKGIPSCAECRVQVIDGAGNILPPMDEELDLIGTAHFVNSSRLSCQMRCFGSVTVDLTEQIGKEKESSKQPQGRIAKKEGEESFAVMGNILEENASSVDPVTVDDEGDASENSKFRNASLKKTSLRTGVDFGRHSSDRVSQNKNASNKKSKNSRRRKNTSKNKSSAKSSNQRKSNPKNSR
jgi:ferredoxin